MTDNLTLNMDAYLPLRDVVFNTLREAILKGEIKPGERLSAVVCAALHSFKRICQCESYILSVCYICAVSHCVYLSFFVSLLYHICVIKW